MVAKLEEFPLAWRWTQASHAVLPADVLAQLTPLAPADAQSRTRLASTYLSSDGRLARPLFQAVSEHSAAENHAATSAWLEALPVPSDERVAVLWDESTGLTVPWHTLSRYWSDFCYPSSDNVLVLPASGAWVLRWHHEEFFEFGASAV